MAEKNKKQSREIATGNCSKWTKGSRQGMMGGGSGDHVSSGGGDFSKKSGEDWAGRAKKHRSGLAGELSWA